MQIFVLLLYSYRTPPSVLSVETHYEAMVQMFGYSGYFVENIPQLQKALREALAVNDRPSILNVIISPTSDRKPQTFNWLTESKLWHLL